MNTLNTFNVLSSMGPQSACMRNTSRQSSRTNNFGSSPSITKAMDQFLTAVSVMKEVVMVPTRLKDEKYYPTVQQLTNSSDGTRSSILSLPNIASQISLATGGNGGNAVLFGSRTGSPTGTGSMDSTSSGGSMVVLPTAAQVPVVEDPDLLLCYKMVDAVRNDLVSGPAYDPVVTTARFVSHSYPHSNSNSSLPRIPTSECFSPVYGGGSVTTPGDNSSHSSRAQSPALEEITSIIAAEQAAVNGGQEMLLADETRFAGFIRAQMQHFLNALHQLTEMAYFLTRTYQEKIGMPEDRLS